MILRLVLAELLHRPGRAAFLLGGYSLGVAVMVVLLSVGEAMLEQARDETLVGGGDIVLVPAGISADMLKAGGATSLFLGIDHARFVQRNVLESARGREERGITAASPVLDGKLVEIVFGDRAFPAVAAGEIPSRAAAVGASPLLLAGSWHDSDSDRRWASPSAQELYSEIDRFHIPAVRDSTWAEWHYFNVVLDEERWLYVTLLVGGEIGVPGRWGGRVLITLRDGEPGAHTSHTADVDGSMVQFDTLSPNLRIGDGSFVLQSDGIYRLRAEAQGIVVNLEVEPSPGRYFPPTSIGGAGLVSGYTAPALLASARGTVCLPACERVDGATAYHDHNWGVWRDVSWEWGSASSDELSLLYGVVREGESEAEGSEGIFAYLVDSRGVRGVFRPRGIEVLESQSVRNDGRVLSVPRRMRMDDARRGLRVEIDVSSVHVTDLDRPVARFFVQMRGVATVTLADGSVNRLEGFFETYVD